MAAASNWDALDPQRSALRTLVGEMDGEVARLGSEPQGAARNQALQSAWASLVKGLDLGAEPELRTCPMCQRGIMAQASRCRYCLKTSSPTPAAPERT